MRRILCGAVWMLAWAGVWGQDQPASPPPVQTQQLNLPPGTPQPAPPGVAPQPGVTTIQAHARAVLLDVVVRDNHGHPIHGLQAKDFTVLEDGAPQRVANFNEMQSQLDQPVAKLPVNTFSNEKKVLTGTATVLLLDALDTAPQWQMYGREQLLDWVKEAKLSGPIAVFSLDDQLHQIQGFTTDVEVLRAAVKERSGVLLTATGGRGYIATQNRFQILTGAMEGLSNYLRTFPGRKNLIWFTGSIPRRPSDMQYLTFDLSAMTDVLRLGSVSVYPVDVEGLRTDPGFDASHKGPPSNGEMMRFAVGQGDKHEDLEDVAHATGGKAFYNTNDIKGAIASVTESAGDYYNLTYYPTNRNWDGKFRKLKIDSDAQEAHLEYREGYYARAEGAVARNATARPSANTVNMRRQITSHSPDAFWHTMHLGMIDPGSIVFRVAVEPEKTVDKLAKGAPLPPDDYMEPKFRDKPYRQYDVNFVADGKQLQIAPTADKRLDGKIEFALVVTDDKGLLVNIYDATVEMNLKPATYQYMVENGIQFAAKIAVPAKGNYFLRAGVHDVPSGRNGALELNMSEIRIDAAK